VWEKNEEKTRMTKGT